MELITIAVLLALVAILTTALVIRPKNLQADLTTEARESGYALALNILEDENSTMDSKITAIRSIWQF